MKDNWKIKIKITRWRKTLNFLKVAPGKVRKRKDVILKYAVKKLLCTISTLVFGSKGKLANIFSEKKLFYILYTFLFCYFIFFICKKIKIYLFIFFLFFYFYIFVILYIFYTNF